METLLYILVNLVSAFFLFYFTAINFVYSILLLFGSFTVYQRKKELNFEDLEYLLHSNSLPEISFIIPSYNEGAHVCTTIDNLLNLSYRYKQIILVNDGSTDNTMELLLEKYQLTPICWYYKNLLPTEPIRELYRSINHPELIVIDKENGKKPDAMNAGLNACQNYYFISVDADTFIDDSSFEALVQPMLTSPKMIAMGASVRIRNGCTFSYRRITTQYFPQSYITAMQGIEFLRAFLMRQGWNYFGGNFCLSGAFAIYVTSVVKNAGGYVQTVADDLEIILRLNRVLIDKKVDYKIIYIPDPAAWTDGPNKFSDLGRQRFLWHRGTMEACWFHRDMFFNPRYGRFGTFVFPFLILGELLEPVIEVLGYMYIALGLWLGIFQPTSILIVVFIIWSFTFLHSIFCLLIEEISFNKYPSLRSISLLFFYSFIENFGYRQMTLYWRLHGVYGFFQRFKEIKKVSEEVNELVEEELRK